MTKMTTYMLITSSLGLLGCGSTQPNRHLQGEVFPSVEGRALSGDTVMMPQAFKGKTVILVIGYKMDTQFDIDRWGIGFFTADLALPPVYEVPTIPGLIPSLFKGRIDKGMRSGIPEESWRDVITVYGGGGSQLARWTGTENPRNARIILLDEEGRVLWSYDRGYGLPPLRELLQKLKDRQQR